METQLYFLRTHNAQFAVTEKYLGWKPSVFPTWEEWLANQMQSELRNDLSIRRESDRRPRMLTIVSPSGDTQVELLFHQQITKETLPEPFQTEERAKQWNYFYIASEVAAPDVTFIIPLH